MHTKKKVLLEEAVFLLKKAASAIDDIRYADMSDEQREILKDILDWLERLPLRQKNYSLKKEMEELAYRFDK